MREKQELELAEKLCTSLAQKEPAWVYGNYHDTHYASMVQYYTALLRVIERKPFRQELVQKRVVEFINSKLDEATERMLSITMMDLKALLMESLASEDTEENVWTAKAGIFGDVTEPPYEVVVVQDSRGRHAVRVKRPCEACDNGGTLWRWSDNDPSCWKDWILVSVGPWTEARSDTKEEV